MAAAKAKTKRARKRKTSAEESAETSSKGAKWTFPKSTLEDAIKVAQAIEEKNGGNPMRASDLVKAVGFNEVKDWRFQDILRSANQYGLVAGTGATATISLENTGRDIVAPSSASQRQHALVVAFRNVEPFQKVQDYYKGKRLPEDEFFLNTLNREFEIPRDRLQKFAEVFQENLKYLNAFVSETPSDTSDTEVGDDATERHRINRAVSSTPRSREFLNSCFVMMPFGEWFDKYYQDIYVPAIREAGFEPVRADELFTTGNVVEQIWEQIVKAKVLLADLSEKNANVFYELGLAHAASKPVIFVTRTIDDIPFDLRHLRIISYDVREPRWADLLGSRISDYLKNALKEPEKSIPHPFKPKTNSA